MKHACTRDTSLGFAGARLLERGRRSLPVFDARGRLIGRITDRAIALALARHPGRAFRLRVGDFMDRAPRA